MSVGRTKVAKKQKKINVLLCLCLKKKKINQIPKVVCVYSRIPSSNLSAVYFLSISLSLSFFFVGNIFACLYNLVLHTLFFSVSFLMRKHAFSEVMRIVRNTKQKKEGKKTE
mmetsp:Transcript_17866/g.20276  ORF Transcript_17866/g.20276 Transcript_17866/m.20276 type:complete len:112 (-) Transcript_17866:1-336(-)